MGKFFSWMVTIFGAPFAAASMYTLISTVVDVGIGPISRDFVTFYVDYVSPWLTFLPRLSRFDPPNWYLELASISLIISAAFSRTIVELRPLPGAVYEKVLMNSYLFVFALFVGYSLAGLVVIFVVLLSARRTKSSELSPIVTSLGGVFARDRTQSDRSIETSRLALSFLVIFFAALLFAFAENWYS